jgi:hypothetical protein
MYLRVVIQHERKNKKEDCSVLLFGFYEFEKDTMVEEAIIATYGACALA